MLSLTLAYNPSILASGFHSRQGLITQSEIEFPQFLEFPIQIILEQLL